ncbi:MAG: transglycosylase SLT domain-containing protein [Thermomonas sp.]|uniref:transglycosylase SLT domain-containing protein n=1 Tax=Thermomonas sp. TaxID=1971895 RepID=UPI0026386AA5|nr:transglycosylase SLT domain-containing protein [Thermomonas sp.]MCC7095612.1 transglycosylase SLT domain-containing protein [Thermomonas sp.]
MTGRSFCTAFILSLVLAATTTAPVAQASSRSDQAAIAVLQQRMAAAENRYRDAQAMEDEDAGSKAAQQALADMQAVVGDCAKQRGCVVADMLEAYERLLKANAENLAGDESSGDPIDEGELAGTDVPDEASANVLLSEEGRRFVRTVQFNPAVQAGIKRWLTDLRPSLMDSYENYRYMQHLMSPAFRQRGLPEALLFGIMAKESNGKVHVGSRAGAVGPLQFMPATGRRFGLGDDGTGFDTRYDPRASADAAAEFLSERLAQLNSSIELALAGYNGGEGRALRVFQATGGRSFWDSDVYSQFPAETKDYVPMVIAAAWLYLHPKDYGIRWPRVSVRPATVQLVQPASLYELTICLGNYGSRDGYLRALRNLNPRWAPATTLPVGTTLNATARIAWLYRLHCRSGSRVEMARELVASDVNAAIVRVGDPVNASSPPATPSPSQEPTPAPSRAAPKPRQHRVRRGESLQEIARKYRCTLPTLARSNGLRSPRYAIHPGQTLVLKGCKG